MRKHFLGNEGFFLKDLIVNHSGHLVFVLYLKAIYFQTLRENKRTKQICCVKGRGGGGLQLWCSKKLARYFTHPQEFFFNIDSVLVEPNSIEYGDLNLNGISYLQN